MLTLLLEVYLKNKFFVMHYIIFFISVGFVPITHTGGIDSLCTTNQYQRNIIVDACIIVSVFGLILLLLDVICCWKCC